MADPYLPPQPGSYDPARNPRDPANTTVNQTRVNSETTRPIPSANDGRGGFSTGIMVALAFVVVAILAAVLYRGTGADDVQTVPAGETNIENNVDPATSAPADAPATAPATTPDAATPDATAPDATAPDATAPDAATGDTVAPDAAAPDAGTTEPAAPEPAPAD